MTFDTLAPTVAITSNVSTLKSGETATITFTFSEDPGSTFTLADVVVSGGSLSTITGSSGLTRTATFTPTASTNGTASITVTSSSYTDAAGNSGGAGTTPTLTFDTLAPTLTVSNVRLSADTGTSNSDLITTTSVQTISATLSGALTTGDILYGSVNAGASWTDISNMVSNGSTTITWGPVTLTGSSSIVFKITDAAGNTGSNIGSTNYSVYNSTPTLSISSDDTTLLAGQTATLTFSFSADPGSSFTLGDVTVSGSGGGLASISGSGLTRTAVFTPIAGLDSGSASISVSAGSYTDIAGNSGGAGSALMLTYDTLAPTQTVSGVSISADTGTSSTDLITNTPTQTISATLSSSLSIGDILYGSVDAGSSWTNITSALTALSISWSTTLLSGSNSIVFKVTDAAGNSGNTTGSTSYTLDVSSYQHSAVYLSSIADGLGGFAIGSRNYDLNGRNYNWDGWGSNISSGGDINGDGLDDLLIATSGAWSYVVFGTTSTQQVKLSDVAAGSGGFVVYGDTSSLSCVAGAGDVNADGLADFLVKANVDDNTSGRNYLVFGKTSTTAVYLSAVAAGSGGFAITGAAQTSSNVDSAGDFNGDGVSDLVIGSVQYYSDWTSRVGKSYVLFGSSAGATRSSDTIQNGSEGYIITGYCLGDLAGRSVAGVGDVNGDGYADLLISADSLNELVTINSQDTWRTGHSFVVFGRSGRGGIDLRSVANGSGGFVVYGLNWEGLGRLVSSTGDVNGDGLADLFVASWNAFYVVFGKTTTTAIASSDLSRGSGGFAIYGDNIGSMNSISSAGDINGDGLADLLIGYSDYTRGTNGQAGITYVVFGRSNSSAVYLSAITSGVGGFAIHGQCTYYSGRGVSAAGDVNGDGLSDLFVNDAQSFGDSYVIFGSTSGAFYPTLVTQLGSASADSISGGSAAETLVGGAGNDTIVGGGGADLIQAGSGDDQITIESTMVAALQTGLGSGGNSSQLSRIDGGSGFDTLLLAGSGLSFDLTQVANQGGSTPGSSSRLESIECINITGSGNNSLTLARRDVQDLAGMNRINSSTASGLGWSNGSYSFASKEARHQLIINGNAGDSLTVADSNWTFDGTALWNGVTYNVYNGYSSINQLLVNATISTSISLVNAAIDLNSIVAGSGGFIIRGRIVNPDGVGGNISNVGDVNGDGLDDLLVGDTQATVGTSVVGSFYVVFGNTSSQPIYLSNIDNGSGGFVVYGQTGDSALNTVSGAGDVNGDGLADILVSSPYAKLGTSNNNGRSYVVFGKTSTASVNLSEGSFTSGNRGFVMTGGASQLSGYSISSAGDFNGDGLADVVIGTNTNSATSIPGKAYVVFGSSVGATKTITDGSHTSGALGSLISGYCNGDLVGYSVAGVGDVNGDGLADLLISAGGLNTLSNSGSAFVVFGRTGTGSIALSSFTIANTISNGTSGFAIFGREGDTIGRVSAAGDVNGDGLADLFICGGYAAFVVFGKTTSSIITMSTIVANTGGFVIYDDFTVGPNNTQIGSANISTAGDINGDGLADLLIGMSGPIASNNILDPTVVGFKGITFVVFGRCATTAVHLSDVAAGSGGFVINGQTVGSSSGSSVSAAGDINGDGLADLLVNTGGIVNPYTYIIYGSTSGAFYSTYVDQLGSTSADTITGTSAAETLVGGRGNDSITGAGADVILAGAGNDLITIDSTMRDALQSAFGSGFNTSQLARIDGGSGIDTLALSGSGVTLDLTSVSNQGSSMPVMASRMNSIEWIDLTGSGNNILKLATKDIQDLTEANLINSSTASGLLWTNGTYTFASTQRQQLVVTGNAGDILQVSGGTWSNAGTATYNGLTSFNVWNSTTGLTQLLVNGSLSVSWL